MNIEKLFRNTVFTVGIAGLSCLITGELFNVLVLRKIGIYIGIAIVIFAVFSFLVAIILSFFFNWRNR
jgi:hypothetical protein